jgi:AcrR family transcriptional regulator
MVNGVASAPAPSATGQALADSARRLIERQGWARTTLAAVAREAGLTTGAVYSQFRGADHLLLETIASTAPDVEPVIAAAGSLEEAVRGVVVQVYSVMDRPGSRHVVAATGHLLGVLVQDEELAALWREKQLARFEVYAPMLAALAERDGVRLRGDPLTAVHALSLVVAGLSQSLALGFEPMDLQTAVAMGLDAIRVRP